MKGINASEVVEQAKKKYREEIEEQIEEIKEELVNHAYYGSSVQEHDGDYKMYLSALRSEHYETDRIIRDTVDQRRRIEQSGRLLNSMINVDEVHKTLTYVLREFNVLDEDGYVKEEYM